MNKNKRNKITITGFILGLITIFVIGIFSYLSISNFIKLTGALSQSVSTGDTIESLLIDMLNAETGQRGFLITGDEKYLSPYTLAKTAIYDSELPALRTLLAASPTQTSSLNKVQPLIDTKFVEMEQTIALRRTQGFAAAQQVVKNDQGKDIMDDIRTTLDEMLLAGDNSTLQASSQAAKQGTETSVVVIVGSLSALFFLVMAAVINRKNLNRLNETQDNLLVAKAKDDALLSSIGDGVVAVDRNGKIILINKKAIDMLGFSEGEILGRDAYEALRIEDEEGNLIPKNKRPLYTAFSLAAYTTTTVTKGIHYYYARKDKTRIPVAMTVSPVIINKDIVGAVEIFHDVTEEKEIDRQKSEFISLASHQLRTPLGSMRWNLEILESEIKSLPEMAQDRLREALKSNLRVIRLVGDLLNVTRIEEGRINDEPALTDIVEIIQSAVKEMEPEAENRKVSLEIKIKKPNIPQINIDPKRFREVIQNLLSNAVKYTLKGGKVEIDVDATDDSFEISVSDTGIGIPEKDKSRIFDKFMRAANASRVDAEGSGLGLFIVKSFIERWGGKLSFESEENKGTTFYVSLPIVQKVPATKA